MPEYCFYPGICQEFPGNLLGNLLLNEFAGKFARRICREFAVNLPAGICLGELATGNLPVEFARGGLLENFPVNLQGNVNLLPKFARNLLGNLPGNSSVNLSREFTKGNLLGKFSVIFVVHYLGICQAICHGNLLRELAKEFFGNFGGQFAGEQPRASSPYYCLLLLISAYLAW